MKNSSSLKTLMRKHKGKILLVGLLGVSVFLHSQASATLITFDTRADGVTPIVAPSLYNGSPILGPHLTEYGSFGVTFDGGVIVNDSFFGGPGDPRTFAVRHLESGPNLLGTTDIASFHLADGTVLPGSITASFMTPVKTVFSYIRNGNSFPATFTLTGYNGSTVVGSSYVSLDSFLSAGEDGTLTVRANAIDRVVITSNQPIGTKDYGIDDFQFSTATGSTRAKDHSILDKIFYGAELGMFGFSVGSLVAAIPTLGISTLNLVLEAVSMPIMAYSIKSFMDPFDPNYTQKFSPVFVQLPLVPADATLPKALADEANIMLKHGSKAISFMQALSVSLDRLSSATQVGDQASIDLQRSAVDTYLALASSELNQYSRGLEMLSVELRSMGLDITITLAQINAFLDDLKARGFAALPPQEQAFFDLFGFDSAFRQSMIDQLLSVNPSDVPQSLVLALSMDATGMGDLSAVYAGPGAAVPEPSTMILIGSGLLGMLGYGRKKFFKK